MRLTKATHDQLEILLFVNDRAPACVPVQTIATALNLSLPNALKHVNCLVHANLLSAKRGPGGGVSFIHSPSDIRLGETVEALEQINSKRVPEAGMGEAGRGDRSLAFLNDALAHFIDILDNFTLADLASGRTSVGGKPQKRRQRSRASAATSTQR